MDNLDRIIELVEMLQEATHLYGSHEHTYEDRLPLIKELKQLVYKLEE